MPHSTRTISGAAYWASYLINGDASGLSDIERTTCDQWVERELADDEEIVDCGEPFFSWSYGFHTGQSCAGGDLIEYTVLTRDAHEL